MNLVKNGTVLLAALSVLAMTSCNKPMDYKQALAWVKEHYKDGAHEDKSDCKSCKITWDYSGNKSNGEKWDPTGGAMPGYEMSINDVAAFALKAIFEYDESATGNDPAENTTGTATAKGDSRDWCSSKYFDSTKFDDEYGGEAEEEDDLKESFKVVDGKSMVATMSYNNEETIYDEPEAKLSFRETEIRELDETGFTKTFTFKMTADKAVVTDSKGEHNLGSMNFTVKVHDYVF